MRLKNTYKPTYSFLILIAFTFVTYGQQITLIDFGVNVQQTPLLPATGNWNNFTVQNVLGTSINLIDNTTTLTGETLTLTDVFDLYDRNNEGTQSPLVSFGGVPMPKTASRDSFFGEKVSFNSGNGPGPSLEPTGGFTLSGLEVGKYYTFRFFASRVGVLDNRETKYIITGNAGPQIDYLNPVGNTSNVATISYVQPNSSGEITIQATTGPNNTNPFGFYYLGAIEMTKTDCASTVTWNGSVWSNGTGPDSSTEAILYGDYDTSLNGGSFSACSLTVDSGFTLTVADNTFAEVQNDVVVDGTLTVETKANFVQYGNSFTVNPGGNAFVNKTTRDYSDSELHYVYWSSPVVSADLAAVFPSPYLNRRYYFDASLYLDEYTTGTTIGPPDDIDDDNNVWHTASGPMEVGRGYAIATDNSAYPTTDPYSNTHQFTGELNTGDISVPVFRNDTELTDTNWNLIGNPYPSAIDAFAFIGENRYDGLTGTIDGDIWGWHSDGIASAVNPGFDTYNFSQADYFIINQTGGIGLPPPFGLTPIPSGQGFFVSFANGATPTGGTFPVFTKTVNFNNGMRIADEDSNSEFYKGSNTKKVISNENANKLWVNLTSDNGVFNQILIGYVNLATDNYDGAAFDSSKNLSSDAAAILYSTINDSAKKFAIQGKAETSISENEIIKLGFDTRINVPTIYTLSVAYLQGDFLSTNKVYLKDNLLHTLHDISASDYNFTSEVGEFKDRFEIVFNAQALSADTFNLDTNTVQIIQLDDTHVTFKASSNLNIKTVTIYDLLGRQLYQLKGSHNEETYNLSNLSNSVFIAKVELSNGALITKKAVKK